MSERNWPFVTVAIPSLNEEEHIGAVLRTFLNQDYKGQLEILVCDGGSSDQTLSVVSSIASENSCIRILKNPRKHQTFALNIMIQEARGELFLRADAHSKYATDYVSACVTAIIESKALNAGGAQRYLAETPFQAAIAFANKSYFGSGNALYKRTDFTGFADTVYLGCFYTETLRSIGGFSEQNIQNQDTELNMRLASLQENAIYLSAAIKAWYFPRKTASALWKQYFRYGKGRRITHDLHPSENKLRGRLPFLMFVMLLLVLVWSPIYVTGILSGVFLLVFLDMARNVTAEYEFFRKAQWEGEPNSLPRKFYLILMSTIAIGIMSLAHALGFMTQTFRKYLPFLK